MRLFHAAAFSGFVAAAVMVGAASAEAAPRTPHSAAIASSSSITLALTSSSTPTAADWIELAGTAPRALRGSRLTLDRAAAKKPWHAAGSVVVARSGHFTIRTRATGVGGYRYRVHARETAPAASVRSNAVDLTVFRWYELANLTAVDDDSPKTGPMTMAGKTYYDTVALSAMYYQPVSHDYNVSYKCSTFAATLGIDDGAESGTTSHDALLADGTTVASADVAVGSTTPVTADIRGIFRLQLQSNIEGDSDSDAGWGDAGVLCSGHP